MNVVQIFRLRAKRFGGLAGALAKAVRSAGDAGLKACTTWRVVVAACALAACASPALAAFEPGARVLLDAHNCYPYNGRWADRITRALSTGIPLAIEQDLVWFRDPVTGEGR